MTKLTELIQPTFYQAIGVVEGILEINDPNNTLIVGNKSFAVTVAKAARKKHQPQQAQYFRVYPGLKRGQTAFKVVSVTGSAPKTFTLKGCWELHDDEPFLVIYRNNMYFPGGKLRTLVSVEWKNAPPTDGQFWELEAELEGDKLIVTKAEGPFDPPPKATHFQPALKAPKADNVQAQAVKPVPTAQTQTTATPLTVEEIRDMATPAKISLTCKLNQVPAHRELPDKQIEFFLNNGADRIFTVRMKPKLFKKLTDHGFAQWVAAISGDLGPSTETGFELLNASIQIFEKKAPADAPVNETKTSAEKPSASGAATAKPSSAAEIPAAVKAGAATARTQTKIEAKTDVQVPVGKRKSLLQGVKLK